MWKRFATMRSYDNMFHGFCSKRKCFQQRLISFRSVLIESDNTCSFHHGNKFLNPVFQCTHVIANSSLSIADQERRERNADNKGNQLNTAVPRRAIITQHKNFYYYLYACKTVVFINIYSSIELTLVFDRTDFWFRSKRTSIETTFDRTDLLPLKTENGSNPFPYHCTVMGQIMSTFPIFQSE